MSRGLAAGPRFVEPRTAEFANLANGAHFAEAVGHSLGDPAFDAEAFGQLAGVKGLRQFCGQEAAQVGGGAEDVDFVDLHQMLVFDEVVVVAASPAAAVAGVTPFFDFDEDDFER